MKMYVDSDFGTCKSKGICDCDSKLDVKENDMLKEEQVNEFSKSLKEEDVKRNVLVYSTFSGSDSLLLIEDVLASECMNIELDRKTGKIELALTDNVLKYLYREGCLNFKIVSYNEYGKAGLFEFRADIENFKFKIGIDSLYFDIDLFLKDVRIKRILGHYKEISNEDTRYINLVRTIAYGINSATRGDVELFDQMKAELLEMRKKYL